MNRRQNIFLYQIINVYFVTGARGVCFRAKPVQHDAATAAAHRDRREKGNK